MSGGYLVPRGDGRYVLGATMEERGFDTTVTAGAVFELLRDAIELLPSVTELVIDELSAGLRPATPDNAPAIGPARSPGCTGPPVTTATGSCSRRSRRELVVGALAGESGPERANSPDAVRQRAGAGVSAVIVTVNGERRELPPARRWRTWSRAPGGARGSGSRGRGRGRGRAARPWPSTELCDGAKVEVVVAVQGG